jgi:hypothetical protein
MSSKSTERRITKTPASRYRIKVGEKVLFEGPDQTKAWNEFITACFTLKQSFEVIGVSLRIPWLTGTGPSLSAPAPPHEYMTDERMPLVVSNPNGDGPLIILEDLNKPKKEGLKETWFVVGTVELGGETLQIFKEEPDYAKAHILFRKMSDEATGNIGLRLMQGSVVHRHQRTF